MKSKRRRKLGRYDTPRLLSEAVADWAVRSPTDHVLEPSSGSGVLVLSVIHRLRSLGQSRPRSNVWACDIDPTACSQTMQNCRLSANRVWNADFLSLISQDGVAKRKFDSVVGNPPYVSLHRMPIRQRKSAFDIAERLNLPIDCKASLWGYFLAASVFALREKGRLALILPESILHAEYGRELLRTTGSLFSGCIALSIRERCFVADGTAERVVLLLGDDFRGSSSTSEIALHESATVKEAANFLSGLTPARAALLPRLNGHAVPHLLPSSLCMPFDLADIPCSIPLANCVDIKIGVVTGANDFFVLSESERKHLRLPLFAVTPILSRFEACPGLAFRWADWERSRDAGKKCWLFCPGPESRSKAVSNYLAAFPEQEKAKNCTFGKRSPWYAVQLDREPDAFLRYMGAYGPRMAFVRCSATCTNSVHRVYFKKDTTQLERKAIMMSLHSSFSQLSAEFEGRAYGSGVLKLEPSEARRVHLLLPHKLTDQYIDKCFRRVEKRLLREGILGATEEIDEWLYASIPQLEDVLPLSHLRTWLDAAVKRRLGDSQSVKLAQQTSVLRAR